MSKWSSAYRDSRWQKKRLEILNRDGFVCSECGASGDGVLLHVHHLYYDQGVAPWECVDESMLTLCDECHEKIHVLKKLLLGRLVSGNSLEGLMMELIGYCDSKSGPPNRQMIESGEYAVGYAAGSTAK